MYVTFAKEPYKRDGILQKRPMILRSLLIVATPYLVVYTMAASASHVSDEPLICTTIIGHFCKRAL